MSASTAPAVDDIAKAARVDNPAGTAMVQAAAADLARGSAMPAGAAMAATGTRPNPGVLPPEIQPQWPQPSPLNQDFPWGINQIYTPRTGYGTPFATLRRIAAIVPEVAMCIDLRKDQITGLTWDFTVRDKRRGPEDDKVINKARAFFASPDGEHDFATWLQLAMDDVLTIDALSIFRRRTRGAGGGRMPGTNLFGYDVIDGATIKVLLDANGRTPVAPQKAYRQIIKGAPMAGADMDTSELIYRPRKVRTWTPYGCSPTEVLLLIVSGALNRSVFNLSYYQEGNIPEALAGVPDTWQPRDIQNFNEYWNLIMRGDPANRSRLRFVPKSIAESVHEFKEADFGTTWEMWLLKVICACYGVTPSDLGFVEDVNRANGKNQRDVSQQRGLKPLATFVKNLLDYMLATDLGLPQLEATWTGGEGEDALTQAKVIDTKLRSGRVQVDEQRAIDGMPPLGLKPGLVTTAGYKLFDQPPASTGRTDAEAAASEDDAAGAQEAAAASDLKKYQTVAVKAVKGGRAVPVFKSQHIAPTVLSHLAARLAVVTTDVDVRDTFRSVERVAKSSGGLSKAQRKAVTTMRRELTGALEQGGADFRAHVAAGVAELST